MTACHEIRLFDLLARECFTHNTLGVLASLRPQILPHSMHPAWALHCTVPRMQAEGPSTPCLRVVQYNLYFDLHMCRLCSQLVNQL